MAPRCPAGSDETAALTCRATSAASAISSGADPSSGGSEPALPPYAASHDHLSRSVLVSQRRQTFSPIPASQGPNRAGSLRASSPKKAWREASCTASSTRESPRSARRHRPSSRGRWRVRSKENAAVSPRRASATSLASSVAASIPVESIQPVVPPGAIWVTRSSEPSGPSVPGRPRGCRRDARLPVRAAARPRAQCGRARARSGRRRHRARLAPPP